MAAPEIYVVYSNGDLAEINTTNFAVDVIGNTGVPSFGGVGLTDIAFAPDGKLYGISLDELYQINTKTGEATAVGPLGAGDDDMNALTFGKNGKAYAYSAATDYLYTVNLKTGAATQLSHASGYYSAGDLAFYNGKLLLSAISETGSYLVTLNPANGAITKAVPESVENLFGLVATNSTHLYGFAGTEMYLLNANTGASAAVADVQLPGDSVDYITGAAYDGYFQKTTTSLGDAIAGGDARAETAPIHASTVSAGSEKMNFLASASSAKCASAGALAEIAWSWPARAGSLVMAALPAESKAGLTGALVSSGGYATLNSILAADRHLIAWHL
jgi:hypothetical protein